MSLADTLKTTMDAERALAEALLAVSRRHASEPDIRETSRLLAGWSHDHARALDIGPKRVGPRSLRRGRPRDRAVFERARTADAQLLQDLLALTSRMAFVEACWIILLQAALASHDQELEHTARACGAETLRQRVWLETKLSQCAPQTLTVPTPSPEPTGRQPADVRPYHVARIARSRSYEGVPLVLGAIAGLGRVIATRGRSSAPSTASAILAGLSLGWTGRTVIQALADRRSGRHRAHEQYRGLRGSTRTARLRDA